MTCPHGRARTKPVDTPASADSEEVECVGCSSRPIPSDEDTKLYHQCQPCFTNVDILGEFSLPSHFQFPRRSIKSDDDPSKVECLHLAAKFFCIESELRRVLTNINEYNRYSSRGPGCRIAELFNGIGRKMCEAPGISPRFPLRGFNCRFGFEATGKRMSDLDKKQRPDIVLVNQEFVDSDEVTWDDVLCPVVIVEKDCSSCLDSAATRMLGFAHHIFNRQYRNFVIGVVLFGEHFILHYFDRSGHYSSKQYELGKGKILEDMLFSLFFASSDRLGYDVSLNVDDAVKSMDVNGENYLIKWHLDHHVKVWDIFGERSIIRVVERNGKRYINKDIWFNTDDEMNEPAIMEHIRGIKNVAQLVNHDTAKHPNGEDITTRITKQWLEGQNISPKSISRHMFLRRHQMIMTPCGEKLTAFTSLEELVSALRDVAYAIADLDRRCIYHGDISWGNIVLAPDPDNPDGLRRGCLIDFGKSIIGRPSTGSVPSGTSCFMSVDILRALAGNLNIRHRAHHDLESLFYVLCWVCTICSGPDGTYNHQLEDTIVDSWIGPYPLTSEMSRLLSTDKSLLLKYDSWFERDVIAHIQPYFADLIPCIRELRKPFMYGERKTYKAMVKPENGGKYVWDFKVDEDIVDKVLKVWDDALAMIRQKVPIPDTPDAAMDIKDSVKTANEDGGDVSGAVEQLEVEPVEENNMAIGEDKTKAQEEGLISEGLVTSGDDATLCGGLSHEADEMDSDSGSSKTRAGSEPARKCEGCDQMDIAECEVLSVPRSKRKREFDEVSVDSGYASEDSEVATEPIIEPKRRKVDVESE